MPEKIYSKRLEAGGKTYFFDVRETQSGDKYLQITESRLQKSGERLRNNIVIFEEHLKEFQKIIDEIIKEF